MRVLVDDQIALLANLRVLEIPSGVDCPLLTVYGFQLRIASGIVTERSTEGVFQRMVDTYLQGDADPASLLATETQFVRFVDPTPYAAEVARAKASFGINVLAAEMIAVAVAEGVTVRLSPGNARGTLKGALDEAEVVSGVWTFRAVQEGVAISESEV